MTNLVTTLIVPTLKFLGIKSHYKRVKIQSVLKKNENVSLFEKKWQYFIALKRFISVVNVINLVPLRPISIKLSSLDVFLLETNEFSKKKHCSALRIEILIVKVC